MADRYFIDIPINLPEININQNKTFSQKSMKRLLKDQKKYFIRARELDNLYVMPKKDEQYRIITLKQYNAFSVIINLILKGMIITEMYLSVYRINETILRSLIEYINNGKIKKCYFVISQFFNATKNPEKWTQILKDYCKTENIKYIYTMNHSKVLAVKTNMNDYIVFEGSGNMSKNANIEQYIYENNEEVFNFHKNWIKEIIENGKIN